MGFRPPSIRQGDEVLIEGNRVAQAAEPPDGRVVREVLAGDVERYAVLVRRYQDRYARYATQMLGSRDAAEDAVQDALVAAFDRLAQCRDPDNFRGWFFLILRNRCFAEQRRARRRGELDAVPEAVVGSSELDLERAESVRAIQRALLELTPEQREVFVLKHMEELSYDEIAARVGTGVAALKMRMHRAYDRLRVLLGGER
jgi:RNA polymerase sigma-70 factor, ECF subfamily